MSNGENAIADSWEEIDDDKLTNQLDEIKKKTEEKNFEDNIMPLQNGNIPAIMLAMRPDDGNYSASKPAVKILRRPTQSSDSRNSNDKPKQPIKTLQQREQEYAEARLRILGSAKNPEDELDAALEKLLTTKITTEISPSQPPITNMGNNSVNLNSTKINTTLVQQQLLLSSLNYHSPERLQRQRQPPMIIQNRQTIVAGTLSNYNQGAISETGEGLNNFNNRVMPEENIVRLPRGPDNTGGFHLRR